MLAACTLTPHLPRRPLADFLAEAEALAVERRYSQAVMSLEEAARLHPETPLPFIEMGRIYLGQHHWLPAVDAFNRALARDLDNPAATAGLAEAMLNQGQSRRALALWQQAIALEPDLPGVYTGLGRTHLLRFEFEAARQAFATQQERAADGEAQWHLAALLAPADWPTAQAYLLTIPGDAAPELLARRDYLLATLAPFSAASPQAEVAQAVGIAFAQVGQWPLAAHALAVARDYPGQSAQELARTLAFLGHALAQAGRPAFELFEQATALDPGSALPAYFYGIYLRRKGALKAAEDLFEQAMALDPDNAAILVELAQTLADQGNFTAAEAYYVAAVEAAPDDLDIRRLRVEFYANRGYRLAEAGIPAAEALIETGQDNAETHDLLGWMKFLAGDLAGAEAALRRAVELDPNLISARYHLARYLVGAGRPLDARVEYQNVIEWDTSGLFRNRAAQELQRLERHQ
jgi:tetratricopeptide (TPR) repeat protein